MELHPSFDPSEIVCIEFEETSLYSEIIQVIPSRRLCWVRPIVLRVMPLMSEMSTATPSDAPILYDLRQGADLLCPSSLFRAALDTEVIPLLVELGESKLQLETDPVARRQLQTFVYRLWQAHPQIFQETNP
ncbi:hypothetical protein H6G89_30310 [Oscillatoria sp. FACHB-1407]|uniref:hypothetical protein n=1 Tax=Oscillatoria sp. FACHB-1407 TaxID=2692847 RepID=UPI00168790D2|nr:hypothetical protein [Oscillatoria sp. FACHB-1407]MBD2465307.1 hypothetical protein [Oscillatoria sp. FACHB-1407]